MEKSSENMYHELLKIETEIENLLSEENISAEKADFYKALKTVIHLKTDSEELLYKFERFQEVFTSLALGDFNQRIDIPNRKNLFTYMGTAINAVIEELEANVVKRQYLEASLEYISHLAIITDKNGTILFANSIALKTFNKPKEDIIRLRIANIFESKTQFGVSNPDLNSFKDVPVGIMFFDTSIKLSLTVKEITDKLGQVDGYLYVLKPI